jgi:hypothetical protein
MVAVPIMLTVPASVGVVGSGSLQALIAKAVNTSANQKQHRIE